jgi:hypothetical protein
VKQSSLLKKMPLSVEDDPEMIVVQGRKLSAKQADKLELAIKTSPDDLRSRLLLLGYYWARQNKDKALINSVARHFMWLLDNAPNSGVLEYPFFYRDCSAFRKVKRYWSEAIKRSPDNVKNLRRAANSCVMVAPSTSVSYLKQAQKLEPDNEDWPHQISHIYIAGARDPSLPADKLAVKQALKAGRLALELHRKYPRESYLETHMEMTVSRLANTAIKFLLVKDAFFFGTYLIDRFAEWEGQLNTKSDGTKKRKFEAHMGHSICGRAALCKGDLLAAKDHLALMAPLAEADWRHDLLLAAALLQQREKDPVLTYLKWCAVSLKERLLELDRVPVNPHAVPAVILMQRDACDPSMDLTRFLKVHTTSRLVRINEWSTAIRSGKRPKLPDYI